MLPAAVADLVRHGHEVLVQAGAGSASGYSDVDYRQAGGKIVADAVTLYAEGQMIVKVKEPVPAEYGLLKSEQVLFSFLHLAANSELSRVLLDRGLAAVAFETIQVDATLPVLAPMSRIAGRLAVHIGATLLHSHAGGRGVLLGGVAGADRGHVVILGAGTVGRNAALLAARLGARVTVFDQNPQALESLHASADNITALPAFADLIAQAVYDADVLIGAVLVPGARAPRLVSAKMVKQMRPGSVIVDTSVDQGGCVETIRPTDYDQPTYLVDGVVHFGVTNMPGAVPRSASQALSGVLLPFVLRAAGQGGLSDPVLMSGLNIVKGKVVHPAVAAAVGSRA